MDSNVYDAPTSDVLVKDKLHQEYYVVSNRKFWTLFLITVGMYAIYWFYKHWAMYREKNNENLWPIPRAIFSIFFAHSLAGNIDESIVQKGEKRDWNPGLWASLFVVSSLVSNIAERMSVKEYGSPYTDVISIALIPVIGWALSRIQAAANQACGDPLGKTNNQFTWANFLWLLLGAIWWGFVVLGLYVIFIGVPEFLM